MIDIFNRFKSFWVSFWKNIKTAYNKLLKGPLDAAVQNWRDIAKINLLDVFIGKLNNLVNTEATFEIISDSTQADALVGLVEDLEAKRYEITESMLADGDYFVFPAHDQNGNIKHTYLTQGQVRIVQVDGDKLVEVNGIIDWYIDNKDRTYYLLRNQKIDPNGTLHISYKVVNEKDEPTTLAMWDYINGVEYQFANANHIGIGRYKSPISSRGLSPVYGVPLNFGCSEIEDKIFNDLKLIDCEFENAKSKIFADPTILREKKGKDGYAIPEYVFPIQPRAGANGSNIDIFNPAIRGSEHFDKLTTDLALYEKQVGTSKGILTDNDATVTATATAIKRANADTIALMDKIRTAIDNGNKMTLEADAVYLNIAADLWDYQSDWYDPFEDPAEQWKRLLEAKQNGAAEDADLIKWLNPSLTDEQVAEKIAKIKEQDSIDTESAIERMIGGA